MKKITIISIILIISSSIFLGCVEEEKPAPTPTPEVTETPTPTVAPTTPTPTLTPAPSPTPTKPSITYKVWIDSVRGFDKIRAVKDTVSINLPADFNVLNFTISVGDRIVWINDDSYNFPITVVSNEGLWTERPAGYLRYNDERFVYIFNKTGTYTFSLEDPRIQHQKITVNP